MGCHGVVVRPTGRGFDYGCPEDEAVRRCVAKDCYHLDPVSMADLFAPLKECFPSKTDTRRRNFGRISLEPTHYDLYLHPVPRPCEVNEVRPPECTKYYRGSSA